jgi:hypothetical protein
MAARRGCLSPFRSASQSALITPDSLCSATWASYADVAPRNRRAAPPGWRRGRRHRTTWLHAAREDASATRCPRDTGVGVRGPATQRLGPFVAFPFRVLRREHTGERLPEHSGKPQRAGSGACCVPPRIGVWTPPNAKRPRQGARGRGSAGVIGRCHAWPSGRCTHQATPTRRRSSRRIAVMRGRTLGRSDAPRDARTKERLHMMLKGRPDTRLRMTGRPGCAAARCPWRNYGVIRTTWPVGPPPVKAGATLQLET